MSSNGLAAAAGALSTPATEIFTVLHVETKGCGFFPDRRPQILYERHIFSRLTNGEFDDGDISSPTPGGYGATGAHQYDRLARAIALNREAALQSASWGIGQIMGENFRLAGFATVEAMVSSMVVGEDDQLLAMARFLVARQLDDSLRSHDWTTFARGYNGPNFRSNKYDDQLNGEFQKLSATGLPDLLVRAVQLYLTYLGFDPDGIDGIAGTHTLSALADFQAAQDLPISNVVDGDTLRQLLSALSKEH
jgi:hypothetical protein